MTHERDMERETLFSRVCDALETTRPAAAFFYKKKTKEEKKGGGLFFPVE